MLDAGGWMLGAGDWGLGAGGGWLGGGRWVLSAGYWVMDAGRWALDAEYATSQYSFTLHGMRSRLLIIACVLLTNVAFSQHPQREKIPVDPDLLADTSLDYDALLDDLDAFLDYLLQPKNYFLANLSIGRGTFNYPNRLETKIERRKELVLSPTFAYYHNSGLGLAVGGNIVNENTGLNPFQLAVTPSYDYIRNMKFVTGLSYSRYITLKTPEFYTTPLLNEVNAYFTWRDTWVQPGISANVGWGTKEEVQTKKKYLDLLRRRRLGLVSSTTTREEITDFTLTASLRHTFYWLEVGGDKTYLKFTPLLSFSAGTQQYGFNTTASYAVNTRAANNVYYKTGEYNLNTKGEFEPQSVMLQLRPELVCRKLFVQPQIIFDYFIPATDENFSAFFALNIGLMF